MLGRSTLLPVMLIMVIVVLAIIAITSGRSNAPDVTGDAAYPHHVCTFIDYCADGNCTRDRVSFVLYPSHADGNPRVAMVGLAPSATLTLNPDGMVFESRGGSIEGRFTIWADLGMDFVGTSGEGAQQVEHFGTGRCEKLQSP